MSGKNKTLFSIISVLVSFFILLLIVLKIQQHKEIEIFKEKSFNEIKYLYENLSKKYQSYYDNVVDIYFNDSSIKEAIKNKNKEELYKFVIKKYKILQKENQNLIGMKFYNSDSSLLLNMNNKLILSDINTDLLFQRVHKLHKASYGIEQNLKTIIYKNIQPVFYENSYIGAVEFDISLKYILDDMKSFLNIDGAIYFKNKSTKTFQLAYTTIDNPSILDENLDNIYTFKITNSIGVDIVKISFLNNLKKEINILNNHLYQILIFLIIMLILSILVISYLLKKEINTIQTKFDYLVNYHDMIDNNIMIVDTSVDGKITNVSQRFCTVSGYIKKELLGKSLYDLKADDECNDVYDEMLQTLATNGVWKGEFKNRTKANRQYWLSANAEAKGKDGRVFSYRYIMHNITFQKQKEEMLYIDELTDTYNKKYFNDVFPRMVHNIKRNGGCVNFIVLNIDNFTKYNEIYGLEKANEALIKISIRLKESLRRSDDYCFRFSGGEFGLLYRSKSEDEGYLYAQVLKKNIEMLNIYYKENNKYDRLTVSLGIVSREKDRINNEKEMYALAYEHLAKAKADGQNKVVRTLM